MQDNVIKTNKKTLLYKCKARNALY